MDLKVGERLAQVRAELASNAKAREKEHDSELEEKWMKQVREAEQRIAAHQHQLELELENQRLRQAEAARESEQRDKERGKI